MRVGSICSGISADSVAWAPLGWRHVFFAEIDPYCCAVLKHYYPDVPNLGDMTKVDWGAWAGKVDVLMVSAPCQAFSVAGLRGSLDDHRGNLTLEAARATKLIRPRYLISEQVPGVLNTRDNAWGCFVGALVGADAPLETENGRWPNTGMVSGPDGRLAWRILDAQFFRLAQRRRRVFLVRCPGGGADPGAVLLERPRLLGHPPSREAARQRTAGRAADGAGVGGGSGMGSRARTDGRGSGCDGGVVCADVSPTLNTTWADRAPGSTAQEWDSERGAIHCPETAGSLTSSGRGVERCGESRGQDPVIAVRK